MAKSIRTNYTHIFWATLDLLPGPPLLVLHAVPRAPGAHAGRPPRGRAVVDFRGEGADGSVERVPWEDDSDGKKRTSWKFPLGKSGQLWRSIGNSGRMMGRLLETMENYGKIMGISIENMVIFSNGRVFSIFDRPDDWNGS